MRVYTHQIHATAFGPMRVNVRYCTTSREPVLSFGELTAMLSGIEKELSSWEQYSALMQFNRTGLLCYKDMPHFERVLLFAEYMHARDKNFDPTVYPILRARKQVPDFQDVQKCTNVGWEHLRHDRLTKTIAGDVQIDFGGIGKGYAIDFICEWLAARQTLRYTVDFSGDLRTSGPILVNLPTGQTIRLLSGALATSVPSAEIVNPNELLGQYDTQSRPVSVYMPTCIEADAWATALVAAQNKKVTT